MRAVMQAEGKWAAATAAEVTGCLRRAVQDEQLHRGLVALPQKHDPVTWSNGTAIDTDYSWLVQLHDRGRQLYVERRGGVCGVGGTELGGYWFERSEQQERCCDPHDHGWMWNSCCFALRSYEYERFTIRQRPLAASQPRAARPDREIKSVESVLQNFNPPSELKADYQQRARGRHR
eukprot:scaffold117418_cov65-Phaeocystis_antarctica.AAC.9